MNWFQKFLCVVDRHEKTDFLLYQFFGSGHFLIHRIWTKGQTSARAKKLVIIKNQFFHARQPRKGIFEIYSLLGCFLMTFFPQLLMDPALPGAEIFSWKSAWVVFFYMQNSNFGVNPESGKTGLALTYSGGKNKPAKILCPWQFCYFDHLPMQRITQMIYHLKALSQSF